MGKLMSTTRPLETENIQLELQNQMEALDAAMDLSSRIIMDVYSVLQDHNNTAIGIKVENWLSAQRARLRLVDVEQFQGQDIAPMTRYGCAVKLLDISRKMKVKLQCDYVDACSRFRLYNYSMIVILNEQRKLYAKLLKLNDRMPNGRRNCERKLPPLRAKVIEFNSKMEKKETEYRKLYELLNKQVSEINKKVEEKYTKKADELVRIRRISINSERVD